jgi:hypothetical protein
MSSNRPSSSARLAAVTIGFAGILHIVIAPAHWQHAPAHGIFFLVAGLVELGWALAFLRKPSRALSYFGIGMASLLLLLWALARVFPAPFGHGPEATDAWSAVCKLSEAVGAVALGVFVIQGLEENMGKAAAVRTVILTVLAGLALGALSYAGAHAAAPYLPSLAAVEEAEDHHHQGAGNETTAHEH